MKWDTREDKIKVHWGMPKGTCQAEVMSNSKEIKPDTLALIELHLSGRQAAGRAVRQVLIDVTAGWAASPVDKTTRSPCKR